MIVKDYRWSPKRITTRSNSVDLKMFQLLKLAVNGVISKVSDGEPLKRNQQGLDLCEEEVLVCKNNVCVHLKSEVEHAPGYFSLKRVLRGGEIPDLVLSWVPNSLLTVSLSDDDGLELMTCSEVDTSCVSASETSFDCSFNDSKIAGEADEEKETNSKGKELEKIDENATNKDENTRNDEKIESVTADQSEDEINAEEMVSRTTKRGNSKIDCEKIDHGITDQDENIVNAERMDDKTVEQIDDRTETENSKNKSNMDNNGTLTDNEIESKQYLECASQKSSTSLSPTHNPSETFSTPYGGIFSISLSDMKAMKLFLTDREGSSGQLVISSLENQYKVFHFHHGGIDKLATVFESWKGCEEENNNSFEDTWQKVYVVSKNFRIGMVTETGADMHPEDGNYMPLNAVSWRGFLNPMGQIEDVNNFRKHVFFAGLSPEVRPDAWKFLLYSYPVQSTSFERDRMRKEHEDVYQAIHNRRLSLAGEEYEKFWKDIQFTVDKDVVRTDRSHPFFTGEDNPNIEKMRNILLNYAVYNPTMGYTQGMSDLLSPLLSTIQDEVDTFWCFVGLMEFSLFATTPTDQSMDKSLGYLRELLRTMYPELYIHCLMQDEDLDLLFCHRWLVLCFKREFIEPEVLKLWEACWSRYQTDYFHIFICVAILRLYGNKCLERKMRMDEMMQYFMDMAMHFDGSAVLREARSLLYRFRKFQVIPCTLQGFLSGPGVWDGGIEPEIECMSRHRKCCFVESDSNDSERTEEEFPNDVDTEVTENGEEPGNKQEVKDENEKTEGLTKELADGLEAQSLSDNDSEGNKQSILEVDDQNENVSKDQNEDAVETTNENVVDNENNKKAAAKNEVLEERFEDAKSEAADDETHKGHCNGENAL